MPASLPLAHTSVETGRRCSVFVPRAFRICHGSCRCCRFSAGIELQAGRDPRQGHLRVGDDDLRKVHFHRVVHQQRGRTAHRRVIGGIVPVETGARMDYPEHEKTYKTFIALAKYSSLVCLALLAAMALIHFGDTSRRIFLYDTFAGMPKPEDLD